MAPEMGPIVPRLRVPIFMSSVGYFLGQVLPMCPIGSGSATWVPAFRL
jgi:hypothetical protein